MIDITIPITFGTGEAKTHVQDVWRHHALSAAR